jgi:hypothetical protein
MQMLGKKRHQGSGLEVKPMRETRPALGSLKNACVKV